MKGLLIFIVCLLLIPICSSVPPQTSLSEFGYVLRTPQIDIGKVGNSINSHMHVFNVSNGIPILPPIGVSCNIHLYNSTGSHILEVGMEPDSNDLEWAYTIDGGNFSKPEIFSFIVYCNDSTAGGFVSGTFEITRTGQEFDLTKSIIYMGLLALLCVFFAFNFYAISWLPSKNNQDEDGLIISVNNLRYFRPVLVGFSWILLMLIFFVSSNIAYGFLASAMMGNILFRFFQMMMVLSLPAVLMFFFFILLMFYRDKKTKQLISRGVPIETGKQF